MDFTELKRSVEPIITGSSYRNVYKLLYYICLFKYSNRYLLQKSSSSFSKIATKEKVNVLFNLGYFDIVDNVIKPNQKTYDIVKMFEAKDLDLEYKPFSLLPKLPGGSGDINEINNTEAFTQAVNLPDYYALLYPHFGYIIPDALLVRKNGNRYKLDFLEIEAKKPNWDEYLEDKRLSYLKLASSKEVYLKWCDYCELLNWDKPSIIDFNFSVTFIGNIKKDWEDYFIFKERL